jgi:hypothetical protein
MEQFNQTRIIQSPSREFTDHCMFYFAFFFGAAFFLGAEDFFLGADTFALAGAFSFFSGTGFGFFSTTFFSGAGGFVSSSFFTAALMREDVLFAGTDSFTDVSAVAVMVLTSIYRNYFPF